MAERLDRYFDLARDIVRHAANAVKEGEVGAALFFYDPGSCRGLSLIPRLGLDIEAVRTALGINPETIVMEFNKRFRFSEYADLAFAFYAQEGELAWTPITFGEGTLDEAVVPIIRHTLLQNGQAIWFKVECFEARDQYSAYTGLHHLGIFKKYSKMGALGYYLVAWVWKGWLDWRLHSIRDLHVRSFWSKKQRRTIEQLTFVREQGLAVPAPDLWPNWLVALRRYAAGELSPQSRWETAVKLPQVEVAGETATQTTADNTQQLPLFTSREDKQ